LLNEGAISRTLNSKGVYTFKACEVKKLAC